MRTEFGDVDGEEGGDLRPSNLFEYTLSLERVLKEMTAGFRPASHCLTLVHILLTTSAVDKVCYN